MNQKNLKFWGHNCFSVETEDSVLIIDPWFNKKGAFFGSWFQYPKNHHLEGEVLDLLRNKKNSFVFVTHEHQDHYDCNFLKKIPENSRIIVPNFLDKRFRDNILNFDEYLMEISDSEATVLAQNLEVKLLISDLGVNHDSAILVKTNEFTFFNQNDCKIFDRLAEIKEEIDFYSVQFSGATRHPPSYATSPRRKERISNEKTIKKLDNVVKGIRELDPNYYLPAAGPAIFPLLDEKLSYGNGNIFIHQDFLKQYLEKHSIKNSIYLKPGDFFESNLTDPILPPSKDELQHYKNSITNIWDEDIDNNFNRSVLEELILERFKRINKIEIKDSTILIFNFSNQFNDKDFSNKHKIFIDLANKRIMNEFDYSNNYYEIVAEKKYFNLMCYEKWQNVALSLREKIVRRPDKFSNILNIFLFSDLEDLNENIINTLSISKERIKILNDKGETYEINRFCPHQGADLCNATITKENLLICPRHGWEFDLNSNGVNKSSGETVNSKKL